MELANSFTSPFVGLAHARFICFSPSFSFPMYETLELTVVEKIWAFLLELISLIADIFEIEMEEILNKIADDNQPITKLIKIRAVLNAA